MTQLAGLILAGVERVVSGMRLGGEWVSGGFGVPQLSEEQLELLVKYVGLLGEWTGRVDLISPATPEEIVYRHIVDSLALWAVMLCERESEGERQSAARVYDIGSGAGLPGVVLAIASPEWRVTLVEPRDKRCVFLQEVRRRLGLKNLTVFQGRFEQFRDSFELSKLSKAERELAPLVVVRALTPDESFERCAKSLAESGQHSKIFYLTSHLVAAPEQPKTKETTKAYEFLAAGASARGEQVERRVYSWLVA